MYNLSMYSEDQQIKIKQMQELTHASFFEIISTLNENNWDVQESKYFTKEVCPKCNRRLTKSMKHVLDATFFKCEIHGTIVKYWRTGEFKF